MAKYRKRPVVIDASQWFKNGDHPLDYREPRQGFEAGVLVEFSGDYAKAHGWEGSIVRYFRRPDMDNMWLCKNCRIKMHEHGWIDTLEGGHTVCPSDWIITGIKGEHYPCKNEIFIETYELVEEN